MQLRISAGKMKNKRLTVSDSAKPVKERVKLAVFSVIGEKIKRANVLDLFAGSGNLGFESLSRGAMNCTFVDNNYDAIGAIRSNLKNVTNISYDKIENVKIEKSDATKYIANHDGYYDIIFIDPPYAIHIIHILKYIHESINEDGLIIYFHSSKYNYDISEINKDLKIEESRQYGLTTVDFIRKI